MQTLFRTCLTIGLLFLLAAAISAAFGPEDFSLDESISIETPWVSKVRHSLLNMWSVKRELAITNDQWKTFDVFEQSLGKESHAVISRFNYQELPSLSPAQHELHVAQLRWKMLDLLVIHDQKYRKVLSPEQLGRLTQLTLQRDLVAGLNQTEVAAKLGLNEQQKEDLRNLAKISARSDLPIGSPNRSFDDCLAVLTEEQKELLPRMMGARFKFPRPRPAEIAQDRPLNDSISAERIAAIDHSDSASTGQISNALAVAPDSPGSE